MDLHFWGCALIRGRTFGAVHIFNGRFCVSHLCWAQKVKSSPPLGICNQEIPWPASSSSSSSSPSGDAVRPRPNRVTFSQGVSTGGVLQGGGAASRHIAPLPPTQRLTGPFLQGNGKSWARRDALQSQPGCAADERPMQMKRRRSPPSREHPHASEARLLHLRSAPAASWTAGDLGRTTFLSRRLQAAGSQVDSPQKARCLQPQPLQAVTDANHAALDARPALDRLPTLWNRSWTGFASRNLCVVC